MSAGGLCQATENVDTERAEEGDGGLRDAAVPGKDGAGGGMQFLPKRERLRVGRAERGTARGMLTVWAGSWRLGAYAEAFRQRGVLRLRPRCAQCRGAHRSTATN